MKFLGAVLIALLALAAPALAQSPQTVKLCIPTSGTACPPVTASAPLPVTGSFSSTISGFTPGLTYASLTAAGTSGSVALPAGVVVAFQNTGTTTVSCTLGVGSATATAGMVQVPPSSTIFLTVGSNTFGACIDESGSVSNVVRLSGGAGLGTGFGGGGGSGGGGAVTIANGADVALGTTTDAVAATPASGTAATLIALAKAINNNVSSAIPAGLATIGTTGSLPYPIGAVPLTASATGTTGATTATLAGTSGKTTYICGYSIRANATASTTVTNTITGVITATLSSIMWIAPAASGIGIDEQIFSPCIPASATNQAIAIVSGAPGTGGLVSSKGWGYQL